MVFLKIKPGESKETTDPVVELALPAGRYELRMVAIGQDKKPSKPWLVHLFIPNQPPEENQ